MLCRCFFFRRYFFLFSQLETTEMNDYVENVIEPMQMFNIFTPQPDTSPAVIYTFGWE